MKLKMIDILSITNSIGALPEMPVALGLPLAKNAHMLQPFVTAYNCHQRALVSKHAKRDESDVIVRSDGRNPDLVNREAFDQELQELYDTEYEVDLLQIAEADLNIGKLVPPSVLAGLLLIVKPA